ncbi:DUF302 domain-containing protein [Thioalkalivibrio sp.]|uniref:DUF302 domain-containing protein n=1 Tax=Thioalkalivibrio sp. TaxID=2093813 RepID=UPI00397597F7
MLVKTSSLSADATVEALKAGIEAQGLRVVAHINGQANAAKLGVSVPADQILEVFRPDFAVRVWKACKPAGIDIPLRIYVYEDDAGVHVACRLPTTVFRPWQAPELTAIGEELDPMFQAILDRVPES